MYECNRLEELISVSKVEKFQKKRRQMKFRKMVKWVIGTVVSVSLMCGSAMGAYAAYNDEIVLEDMDVAEDLGDSENIGDDDIELNDTEFVGEMQSWAITGEEKAIPMANHVVPYANSGALTYSWGLYPDVALAYGAEAKAVSKAKKRWNIMQN